MTGTAAGDNKMDASAEAGQRATLSDYLAAERTLLAWIRTGLALMGFGFVVARFGLFLQQLQIAQHASSVQPYGLSLWFGTTLIGAGVAVNLFSGWHHLQLIRIMELGHATRSHTTTLAVATSLFLALVGFGMAIYLISVRDSTHSQSGNNEETLMAPNTNNGIVSKRSNRSVDETLERLKGALQAKGVTIFAIVDHSGEAEKVGLKMLPTKLVVFGSPKAGTPLMLAAPSIAIDLPLKILISEDREGKVWVSYNSVTYLQERHRLPKELLQNIAVVETLAAAVAE
jgi:uncharacterized protein (DUF302 family)/uncharacterized membrane protein YidH (DUF202 family)